jgi:hypothetical protein
MDMGTSRGENLLDYGCNRWKSIEERGHIAASRIHHGIEGARMALFLPLN